MASGGSYKVEKAGDKPVLQECTQEHKNGNRPRDGQGNELRSTQRPAEQNKVVAPAVQVKPEKSDKGSTAAGEKE